MGKSEDTWHGRTNNQGSEFCRHIKEIAANKLHSLNLISGDDHYKSRGDLHMRWECGEVEETQADLKTSPAKEF